MNIKLKKVGKITKYFWIGIINNKKILKSCWSYKFSNKIWQHKNLKSIHKKKQKGKWYLPQPELLAWGLSEISKKRSKNDFSEDKCILEIVWCKIVKLKYLNSCILKIMHIPLLHFYFLPEILIFSTVRQYV